jgi:hypothetical protein
LQHRGLGGHVGEVAFELVPPGPRAQVADLPKGLQRRRDDDGAQNPGKKSPRHEEKNTGVMEVLEPPPEIDIFPAVVVHEQDGINQDQAEDDALDPRLDAEPDFVHLHSRPLGSTRDRCFTSTFGANLQQVGDKGLEPSTSRV